MKIATLTYQRHDNYGAMLQCYALQKKIEQLGHETEVIDYVCKVSEHPFSLAALRAKGIKRYITGGIGAVTRLPRAKKFKEFRKLLKMTQTVTEKNISVLGGCFDGYIVGSDNVWNADITGLDERYFLSFVGDKRRRASFAASFGSSNIKEVHREQYARLLSDFAVINCREKSGAKLAEELTGREADVVCDPSLLLTKEEWSNLAVEPKEQGPYVLAYQMVPSGSFVRFVEEFAEKKGLPVIYIPFPYGKTECKIKPSIGPLEWLGYFKNASYVLTDSFHGCAFSVLFEREFAVKISQLGERIENLLGYLDIKNRVVTSAKEADDLGKIDYQRVGERLVVFREYSVDRLVKTIDYFGTLSQNGIVDPSSCTGCMLCKTACAKNAIGERRDELGFVYPKINPDLCVGCGECERACEALGQTKKHENQRYYSAINNNFDIVQNSASGGTFYQLAAAVCDMGGSVYGAAFQTGFAVMHERAADLDGVRRLMGTKYTQSSMEGVYSLAADDLKAGLSVLFVGTPCQCDAIKAYLEKNKLSLEKLYLCDLFCHGVFSPQLWQEYIEFLQSRFKDSITYISFRDKKKGWRNKRFKILTASGDISKYCNNNASALRLYEQNISFRSACYKCKYMSFNRVGDISIGDFWGIERIKPSLDKNTGVSAIITSNEKGEKLFEMIKADFAVEEFSSSQISQQVLRGPTPMNSKRSEFISDYVSGGIEQTLSKYGKVKGLVYIKRSILVPLLYKLRLAGAASKFLHRKDKK